MIQRGRKGKGKGNFDRKGKGKGKGNFQCPAGPATCLLCNSGIHSLHAAVSHLRSERHRMAVVEAQPELAQVYEPFPGQLDFGNLREVLLDPHFKRFHQQLGYAVDEVLAAIPHFEQLQTVRDEIHALSDDPSWVRIKDRVLAHWDNTFEEGCSTHGLTKAPHLQDLLRRCSFDRTPPVITIPTCPAALPQLGPASHRSIRHMGAHQYPDTPGICRFGIAIMVKHGKTWHELGGL